MLSLLTRPDAVVIIIYLCVPDSSLNTPSLSRAPFRQGRAGVKLLRPYRVDSLASILDGSPNVASGDHLGVQMDTDDSESVRIEPKWIRASPEWV